MEQRRFFEVRGEESDEWLVLDGKSRPPRVVPRLERAEKCSAHRGCLGGAQFGALLKIHPRRFGAAQ